MDDKQQLEAIKSHVFDSWAKDLINTPPKIDPWQKEQVGPKNDGPYRDGYAKMPIKEVGEPLLSLNQYGVSNNEYYLEKVYDELLRGNKVYLPLVENRIIWPFVWVRQSLAERLAKADALLRKHDLFLKVISGWRHPLINQIAKEEAGKRLNLDEAERLFAKVSDNLNQSPTPHSTGAAVDTQVYSLQSFRQLSPNYPGDEYSFYNLETKEDPSEIETIKKGVRRILYHVLCTPGVCLAENEIFTIHPGEYWHFGDGDPLSAFLNQEAVAKFGYIEPPKDFRITRFS